MSFIDLTTELPPHILEQPEKTTLGELDTDPTIIQYGTCRRVAPRTSEEYTLTSTEFAEPQPYATITPETKPLNEYESPLTVGMMTERFGDLITLKTGLKLFDTELDSDSLEYYELHKKAKKEITVRMVHKIGVPSDYIRHIDIDEQDTRDLLERLFLSIPDTVDRENSLNGFSARTYELKDHIIAKSKKPEIAKTLRRIDEHWIADMEQREKILSTQTVQSDYDQKVASQREDYLERLVNGDGSSNELIGKIGNCLLHLTQKEIRSVLDSVDSIRPSDEAAQNRIKNLRAMITELHLTVVPVRS